MLLKQREDSTVAQIQIIGTDEQPIFAILKGFYTTLVVNVISWNKAYALFPQPSFLYHKTYLLKSINEYFGKLLMKYEKRGWKSQDTVWPEDKASHRSILESRRVGDRWTWIVPLNDTGVDRSETPDSVLEYSTFRLSKREWGPPPNMGCYGIEALQFRSLVLKYRYLNSKSVGGAEEFWPGFAGPRLERLNYVGALQKPFNIASPAHPGRDGQSDGLRILGKSRSRILLRHAL